MSASTNACPGQDDARPPEGPEVDALKQCAARAGGQVLPTVDHMGTCFIVSRWGLLTTVQGRASVLEAFLDRLGVPSDAGTGAA